MQVAVWTSEQSEPVWDSPRVALDVTLNSFLQRRSRKLDFPTAASPARTIL